MKFSRIGRQRITAAALGLSSIFFLLNHVFDLGFFGDKARGMALFVLGVGIVWAMFFAPTRQELRDDDEARKKRLTE